jgi:AraC-like DNA-binding protein
MNGLVGQSFRIYDEQWLLWHQTWVTNRGQLLMVGGRLRAGVPRFHPEESARLCHLARLAREPAAPDARLPTGNGRLDKTFATRVKAQFANDLLRDSDLSRDEVAGRCGFQDSRQMRRLFKEAYGTTPAAFRRARRPTELT